MIDSIFIRGISLINNSGDVNNEYISGSEIFFDDVNATITNSGTIQGHGSRRAIHIQDTGTETGTTINT